VEAFRAALAARFGKTVPNAGEIQGWIARYTPHTARGKLTFNKIVTKIAHGSRLFEAQCDEEHARDRVRKALERDK
jgi:hypothetical protein